MDATGDEISKERKDEVVDTDILAFLFDHADDALEESDGALLGDLRAVAIQAGDVLRVHDLPNVPVGGDGDGGGFGFPVSAVDGLDVIRSDTALDMVRGVEFPFEFSDAFEGMAEVAFVILDPLLAVELADTGPKGHDCLLFVNEQPSLVCLSCANGVSRTHGARRQMIYSHLPLRTGLRWLLLIPGKFLHNRLFTRRLSSCILSSRYGIYIPVSFYPLVFSHERRCDRFRC